MDGDAVQNQPGVTAVLAAVSEKEVKGGLENSCQKQGSEEVIEFAAGTLESMSNLQVMRRIEALDHL